MTLETTLEKEIHKLDNLFKSGYTQAIEDGLGCCRFWLSDYPVEAYETFVESKRDSLSKVGVRTSVFFEKIAGEYVPLFHASWNVEDARPTCEPIAHGFMREVVRKPELVS